MNDTPSVMWSTWTSHVTQKMFHKKKTLHKQNLKLTAFLMNDEWHLKCDMLYMNKSRYALQLTATHCNIAPRHTATHCNTLMMMIAFKISDFMSHTATHCNAGQFAARHWNTLQHTATHCNTLQHTATHCNTLQRSVAHYNTLHHTVTHCNTL